jgi:hypothetical protein
MVKIWKNLEVDKEYDIDTIEKFLQANGVDTFAFDDNEPIEIGMALTFRFDDSTIATTLILTGYTSIAIYKIAYLAESLS